MAAADRRAFVDTNVLLYAHNSTEATKQPIARTLLEGLWQTRMGVISTQVLQEFYVVATGRFKRPLARNEAREIVELYSAWPVVLLAPSIILSATQLEERHQVSFWDALILEAARVAGAERLLTEDMQHGQVIEGVRVENPFISATSSSG
jgi:predicted nucleic acid-binding protein